MKSELVSFGVFFHILIFKRMQYQSKYGIIEAVQFRYNSADIEELNRFGGPYIGQLYKERHLTAVGTAELLDDYMNVVDIIREGDYLVKDVEFGRLRAVKRYIFERDHLPYAPPQPA